jgi:hypothetical protein
MNVDPDHTLLGGVVKRIDKVPIRFVSHELLCHDFKITTGNELISSQIREANTSGNLHTLDPMLAKLEARAVSPQQASDVVGST